ncbi:MAG: endonuclease III [Christensenellales bacterium]|jgi:endonuclease-3
MGNTQEILTRLKENYLGARSGLKFGNAFELLISTILSAQTTDRQVNAVTKTLFKNYPDALSFLDLDEQKLGEMIKSCGFYKTKAKNIIKTCKSLVEQYGGQVPCTMDELVGLAGVGRKTASVVLSNAFGIPAIAVDTHVFRVSNRLGLADAKDVSKTEKQLMHAIPKDKWSDAHHWLIWHGRSICRARKPRCDVCFLRDVCKSANT